MKVAYTIDAGFHVFIFTLKSNKHFIMEKLLKLNICDTNESILEKIIHTKIGKEGTKIIYSNI